MDNSQITISLAIASGLAVISYKTPQIYKKLFYPLVGILWVSELLVLAWTMGYTAAFKTIIIFVASDKLEQASKISKASDLNSDYFTYAAVAFAYLGFLYWLSFEVIKHTENKEPKKEML